MTEWGSWAAHVADLAEQQGMTRDELKSIASGALVPWAEAPQDSSVAGVVSELCHEHPESAGKVVLWKVVCHRIGKQLRIVIRHDTSSNQDCCVICGAWLIHGEGPELYLEGGPMICEQCGWEYAAHEAAIVRAFNVTPGAVERYKQLIEWPSELDTVPCEPLAPGVERLSG
jgi:hypothetical protein